MYLFDLGKKSIAKKRTEMYNSNIAEGKKSNIQLEMSFRGEKKKQENPSKNKRKQSNSSRFYAVMNIFMSLERNQYLKAGNNITCIKEEKRNTQLEMSLKM